MSELVFDGASLITPGAITTEIVSAGVNAQGKALVDGKAELALVLGLAHRQFEQGSDPAGIIHKLFAQLHDLRGKLDPDVWHALLPIAQSHPVSEFFHQDPLTRWSFEKPRGYSGDAHLLDFIYGHPSVDEEVAAASPLGKALNGCTETSCRVGRRAGAARSADAACRRDRRRARAGDGNPDDSRRASARSQSLDRPARGADQAVGRPRSGSAQRRIDHTRLQGNARRRDRRLGSRPADQRLQARPVRLRLRGRPVRLPLPTMSR